MLSNQLPFIAAALVAACQAHKLQRTSSLSQTEVSRLSYPGDLCCTLYEGFNWGRKQVNVCLPSADHSGEIEFRMKDYDIGDGISSWWCGKSVSYDFCVVDLVAIFNGGSMDDTTDCTDTGGMSGAGHARSAVMGHNDQLLSVKLRGYDAAKQGAVTAFEDKDCKGDFGRFDSTIDPHGTAEYTETDMKTQNLKNDYISSIMVPQGYTVELFKDDGFGGGSVTMSGLSWTSDDQAMVCQHLPDLGD